MAIHLSNFLGILGTALLAVVFIRVAVWVALAWWEVRR